MADLTRSARQPYHRFAFLLISASFLSLALGACADNSSPTPSVVSTPVSTSGPSQTTAASVTSTAVALSGGTAASTTAAQNTSAASNNSAASATAAPTPVKASTPTDGQSGLGAGSKPTALPSLSPLPVPTVAASAEAQKILDTVAGQTSKTRKLDFKTPVERNFMTRDDLAKYQVESFKRDNPPEELAKYEKTLEVFGLAPKGFDLAKTETDLLTEQVLGFYDPQTKKLYIIVDKDPNNVSPLIKFTTEHELTHGLQDQYYDLQKLRPSRKPGTAEWNDDKDLALTALIEGDAVTSQTLWLQAGYLTRQELNQFVTETSSFSSDKLNTAPLILKETLTFPYDQGFNFVQNIYKKGGWDAVTKLFTDYSPRSTSQILHPEKFEKRVEPVQVEFSSLVDTLGQGWQSLDINTMGELQARILLNGVLSKDDAGKAVSGWAGDRYQVLADAKNNYGYAWRTQWDSESNAADFMKAMVSYATKTYNLQGSGSGQKLSLTGPDKDVSIVQKGNQVMVVVLPKGSGVDKVNAKFGF